MKLTKIQFEDGQKVSDAYVEIDGVKHNITKAQYQGKTPLSARNLNLLQENIGNAIVSIPDKIAQGWNQVVEFIDESGCVCRNHFFHEEKAIECLKKIQNGIRSGGA